MAIVLAPGDIFEYVNLGTNNTYQLLLIKYDLANGCWDVVCVKEQTLVAPASFALNKNYLLSEHTLTTGMAIVGHNATLAAFMTPPVKTIVFGGSIPGSMPATRLAPLAVADVFKFADHNGNTYDFVLDRISNVTNQIWKTMCTLESILSLGTSQFSLFQPYFFDEPRIRSMMYLGNKPTLWAVATGNTLPAAPTVGSPNATSYIPVAITISSTPKEKSRCKCDADHPHNERGCYYGMCGCRVAKKS